MVKQKLIFKFTLKINESSKPQTYFVESHTEESARNQLALYLNIPESIIRSSKRNVPYKVRSDIYNYNDNGKYSLLVSSTNCKIFSEVTQHDSVDLDSIVRMEFMTKMSDLFKQQVNEDKYTSFKELYNELDSHVASFKDISIVDDITVQDHFNYLGMIYN